MPMVLGGHFALSRSHFTFNEGLYSSCSMLMGLRGLTCV